jgi:hypothetical protein
VQTYLFHGIRSLSLLLVQLFCHFFVRWVFQVRSEQSQVLLFSHFVVTCLPLEACGASLNLAKSDGLVLLLEVHKD